MEFCFFDALILNIYHLFFRWNEAASLAVKEYDEAYSFEKDYPALAA